MKAEKITLSITIEALSSDCFYAMLTQVIEQIDQEFLAGKLVAADGDTMVWNTTRTQVEF